MSHTEVTTETLAIPASNYFTTPALEDLPTFKWSMGIMFYGFLAIIIFGTLSNIASLIVLRCKSFRTSSVSGSLSVLSVLHLAVIYVAIMRSFIYAISGIDIRGAFVWCNIHVFLTYLLNQLASWTLTLIVIERALIVCFPLIAKPFITRKNAVKVWLATAFVLVCVNCHFFFTFKFQPDPYRQNSNLTNSTTSVRLVCCILGRYSYFYDFIWPWIDNVALIILPFLLIFTGNLVILVVIKKALAFQELSHSRQPRTKESKSRHNTGDGHHRGNPTHSTLMLLGTSVAFLILTLPSGIYFIVHNSKKKSKDVYESGDDYLAYSTTLFCFYLGISINFLVYYLTGSKFRKSFKECFSTNIFRSEAAPLSNRTVTSKF